MAHAGAVGERAIDERARVLAEAAPARAKTRGS